MSAPDTHPFDDRPVELVAEPVPGVKNTGGTEKIDRRLMVTLAGHGIAPLVDSKRRLIHLVSDMDELSHGADSAFSASRPPFLTASASVGEARQLLAQHALPAIPILKNGRYTGLCATRGKLDDLDANRLRPRTGGLATPLGVYMTSGRHTAGAGLKGMLLMGVVFGTASVALDWLYPIAYSLAVALYPPALGWSAITQEMLHMGFVTLGFLSMMRFTPLSALHAAEHMTIHALEKNLNLDEPHVRRQPRAHPRCGTNLAVAFTGFWMMLYSCTSLADRVSYLGIFLYSALWVALIYRYWLRSGMWVQWHFTTKTPNSPQLHSGIKAGRELLDRFSADPHPLPPIHKRLWTMGIVQLLGGSMAAMLILQTVLTLIVNHGRLPQPYWLKAVFF